MTDRYVGSGGNDGDSGLTWALRKLTLNGVEDTPVVAGDDIYVGPGVYREQLTVDVSGAGGNIITYIADVTGENTDGVGGLVRITASDNDTTATRTICILNAGGYDYRTFRGFKFEFGTSGQVRFQTVNTVTNWILEDCIFGEATDSGGYGFVTWSITGVDDITIRRCIFFSHRLSAIYFNPSGPDAASSIDIENCIFFGDGWGESIKIDETDGITIRNCTFHGCAEGIDVDDNNTNGYTTYVYNCYFAGTGSAALEGGVIGDITEDYNSFWNCFAKRVNTNTGANSQSYPMFWDFGLLFDGIRFQKSPFAPSDYSALTAITGTGELNTDLFGIARPATAAKNSWGAIQFHDAERETTTTRGASTASITLHDAGVHQIWVPVTNVSTTISVYVYREANYAGTNPRLVVKQPGQSDDTTTDAAAASQWNELTTTLTPAADPPYVVVELQSLNTAAAGNYDIFFDDLTVT